MNTKKELTFYFDYISPYAFLAWKQIGQITEKYNLILKPEPIVFGAVLSHCGNIGPAEIPVKREYTYKDVMRIAARRNINLKFPPLHPFNPLSSLRATCILENSKRYFEFIDKVFDLCWIDGKDISDINNLIPILNDFSIENPSDKINSTEVKMKLKDKTEKAIRNKVFGVPSMIIDNELFWGDSSIVLLEDYLQGKYFIDENIMKEILDRPKGIERKKG